MTLIIAAQGKDFMVVGADTREIIGTKAIRVEVNLADKIIEVSPHVAILTAGDAGQAQYLVEKFKKQAKNRQIDGITKVAEGFAKFCKEEARKDADVPKHPEYFPNFAFIVAGLGPTKGKYRLPRCYGFSSVEGFALKLWKEGFALDGKPMLAYYLFEKNYPKVSKSDEVCKLVGQTLYDTSRVDGDVGFHFKMAIIRDDGFTWFTEEEIRQNFIKDKW